MTAAAVDLQGHRGTRGLAPENTLAAFRKAIEIGVTTLETDLALTADDVLVLVHDPRLSRALTRTGDGRWLAEDGAPIRSLTSVELRAYDVGRLDPSHPDAKSWPQQVPADGERIPTLAQLFALARDARSPGGRPVRFNIETKLTPDSAVPTASAEEFARAVAREIAAAGMTERVTVQSFDWRTLRALKRVAPEIRTACLTIEAKGMNTVRADASGASPWHDGLKRADHGGSLPRTVQAAGLRCLVSALAQPDPGSGGRGARAGPGGDCVDGQRTGRHRASAGPRCRRDHHRLSGPRAQRPRAARSAGRLARGPLSGEPPFASRTGTMSAAAGGRLCILPLYR